MSAIQIEWLRSFVMLSYIQFIAGQSCSKDEFSCSGGGCVLLSLTCDGEKNCEDGSDEPTICGDLTIFVFNKWLGNILSIGNV